MARVLVAPNAFKTVADAPAVAEAWGRALRREGFAVDVCPLADGGDGTLEVLARTLGGRRVAATVSGPLGGPVRARWLRLPDGTGFVESAAACGMRLLAPGRRGGLRATTRGVGELVARASSRCPAVTVGVGGTAATDGGRGAVEALREARPAAPVRLALACDVRNPLLGPRGAAAVYGPQKGVRRSDVPEAERRLGEWAASFPGGRRLARRVHTGAGGGLAFGLAAAFGAELRSGFEIIAETVGFAGRLRDADVVLTGEGSYDGQSGSGKATGEVIRLARRAGVPVAVVAGTATTVPRGVTVVRLVGLDGVRSPAAAVRAGLPLMVQGAQEAMRLLRGGGELSPSATVPL